jgi:hypothetical protein
MSPLQDSNELDQHRHVRFSIDVRVTREEGVASMRVYGMSCLQLCILHRRDSSKNSRFLFLMMIVPSMLLYAPSFSLFYRDLLFCPFS